MKKIITLFIIPMFATLSLIGVGFSTWYFSGSQETSSISNIGVTVDKFAQVGELDLETFDVYLIFNQNTIELSNDIVAKYKYIYAEGAENARLNFTYDLTISDNLLEYVLPIGIGVTVDANNRNLYHGVWGLNYDYLNPESFSEKLNIKFEYKKNMCPVTIEDYNEMLAKVRDCVLDIDVKVTIAH